MKLTASNVHPMPIISYVEMSKTTKLVHNNPVITTKKANPLLDSFLIKKAYKILPIYSKKSDQLGPLRGYISPLPRTS